MLNQTCYGYHMLREFWFRFYICIFFFFLFFKEERKIITPYSDILKQATLTLIGEGYDEVVILHHSQ